MHARSHVRVLACAEASYIRTMHVCTIASMHVHCRHVSRYECKHKRPRMCACTDMRPPTKKAVRLCLVSHCLLGCFLCLLSSFPCLVSHFCCLLSSFLCCEMFHLGKHFFASVLVTSRSRSCRAGVLGLSNSHSSRHELFSLVLSHRVLAVC